MAGLILDPSEKGGKWSNAPVIVQHPYSVGQCNCWFPTLKQPSTAENIWKPDVIGGIRNTETDLPVPHLDSVAMNSIGRLKVG
jgi:hypothetical protein